MTDEVVTPAHDQTETIHLLRHYEAHHPRSEDPNYHLFEEAKARMKRLGLWHCVIANSDCSGETQCHHDDIEFAYQNSIDVQALAKLLGLHLDDDSFAKFIEGPGNLEPLCLTHHMGRLAVHHIPAADWTTVRTRKDGLVPVEVVTQSSSPLSWV